MTLEEVIITLTHGAIVVAEGEHPPEAVDEAIQQLMAEHKLPSGYIPYLQALLATLRDPNPTQLDRLQEKAPLILKDWPDPAIISLWLTLARLYDRNDYAEGAVGAQQEAIRHLRKTNELHQLTIALYNQAGHLAQLDRFDEAVAALEEVVAIDEQLGLADLEADRASLEQMKRRQAGLPPEVTSPVVEAALTRWEARLAELPPEAQEEARQKLDRFRALNPAEQEAAILAIRREHIEQAARGVVEAARQAQQQGQAAALIPQLEQTAAEYAAGERPDSPYIQLAQFIRAIIARLQGEPDPPVPPEYQDYLTALE